MSMTMFNRQRRLEEAAKPLREVLERSKRPSRKPRAPMGVCVCDVCLLTRED